MSAFDPLRTLAAPVSFGRMTAKDQAAEALADEWLQRMGAIAWDDAAKGIQRPDPYPTGETTSIEEGGVFFDVSDSWRWHDTPRGDILLSIEVYESGFDELLATRTAIIRRQP
jgi:hypothetical protein